MDKPNSKPNLIPALIVLLLHLMRLVMESSLTADFLVSKLVVTGLCLKDSFKCDSIEPAVWWGCQTMLNRYHLSTLFVIDPTAAAGHDGGLEECSQYNIRGFSQQQTSNGHLSHALPYSEAESVSVRLICTYPQTCKLSHASIGDSQNSPSKFMLCCAKINPFP